MPGYDRFEQEFLGHVAQHQLAVMRDDGVYRHIRLRAPNTGNRYFDLITWPGHLCYTGDMGSFVFSRIDDMFDFFRADQHADAYAHKQGATLSINPGYWAEKVLATYRSDGIVEFDNELFVKNVKQRTISWLRDHWDVTNKPERRELWDAVVQQVLEAPEGEHQLMDAAYSFQHRVNTCAGTFHFQDFWELSHKRYTYRYIWCCYALVWAIKAYDKAKQAG